MAFMSLLKVYLGMAAVFFAIDLVWIGLVAASFYQEQLGHLLSTQVRWGPALIFYTIFIAGILVFAVLPGLDAGSLVRTVTLGAFLGFFSYATFDLTCLALFKDFPTKVAVVDMIWGSCLSAFVSGAGFAIGRWAGLG